MTGTQVALDPPRRRSEPVGERVRVVLVRPTTVTPKFSISAPVCPPLGLAYVAGTLVAGGHQVEVVDAIGEALEQFLPASDPKYVTQGLTPDEIAARIDPDADVVGFSCMFSHDWPMARRCIDAVRARCPSALIVAGGEHITAVPHESLADCPSLDVAVLGEGEETMAAVVAHHADRRGLSNVAGIVYRPDVEGTTVERTDSRARMRSLDEIPLPPWDLFPLENYLASGHSFGVYRGRSFPILATRGCPYQCTFCSSPAMWTTRYELRSPASVLAEIRAAIEKYDVCNFDFYDLTMIVRKAWIVEFCNLVVESGLKFSWQLPSGTRSEAIDAEIVGLLYAAGLRNISYAPESGSKAVLERIKKRVDLEHMKDSMRVAVGAGINCKANVMIGYPDERRGELYDSFRFIAQVALLGLQDLTVAPFSPYPGTELFEGLRERGLIGKLDDDYYLALSYSDLSKVDSWCERMGSRELAAYRVLGMSLFYGISFARRPWRIPQLLHRVWFNDTQESRLEQALHDMKGHFRQSRSRSRSMVS